MSFIVQTGSGGLSGWAFLQKTTESQKILISQEQTSKRNNLYLKENVGALQNGDAFVSNFQLMKVTLTAFGLENDVSNKAFIKKVISSDINDTKSFANRLGDKRYLELATFFSNLHSGKVSQNDAHQIVFSKYIDQTFEMRVGDKDGNLRIAISSKNEMKKILADNSSESAKWYKMLGNPPVRKLLEGAFGLPPSFGKLPIDRQHVELKSKARGFLGSDNTDQLKDSNVMEKIIERFILRSSLNLDSTNNRFSSALTLLSNAR